MTAMKKQPGVDGVGFFVSGHIQKIHTHTLDKKRQKKQKKNR